MCQTASASDLRPHNTIKNRNSSTVNEGGSCLSLLGQTISSLQNKIMKNKSTEEYLLAPHTPFTMEAVHSNIRGAGARRVGSSRKVKHSTKRRKKKKTPKSKKHNSPKRNNRHDIIILFSFYFFKKGTK